VNFSIQVLEAHSQNGGAIFRCIEIVFAERKLIFHYVENFLLHESQFHIVNCLKSLDLNLFIVYTFKLLRGPFGTFAHRHSNNPGVRFLLISCLKKM